MKTATMPVSAETDSRVMHWVCDRNEDFGVCGQYVASHHWCDETCGCETCPTCDLYAETGRCGERHCDCDLGA